MILDSTGAFIRSILFFWASWGNVANTWRVSDGADGLHVGIKKVWFGDCEYCFGNGISGDHAEDRNF